MFAILIRVSSQYIIIILCVSKTPPFYICNNSAKNEPILIIFGVQNPEKISHLNYYKLAHLTWIMLSHYLVKNNSSEAACWIVDNTHNTSTGSCDSHPIITGETIINSVNWTLQTRHTVE